MDIAVDDALLVRESERRRDLPDHLHRPLRADMVSAVELCVEVVSSRVGGDEVGASGLPPVVIDRHDVRMLKRRHCLCVWFEASDEVVRGRGGLVEDLYG